MPNLLPYYADFLSWLTPGGTGPLTAQPGEGVTQPPGSGVASDNTVPTSMDGTVADILRQFGPGVGGGQQQGSLAERLSEALARGFADPTIANAIAAVGNAMAVASPMGPVNLGAGYALQEAGLPASVQTYASPALRLAGQMVGMPLSPTTLTNLQGFEQFPPDLAERMRYAQSLTEIQQILAEAQRYQEASRAAREAGQLGGGADERFSVPESVITGQGLNLPADNSGIRMSRRSGAQGPNADGRGAGGSGQNVGGQGMAGGGSHMNEGTGSNAPGGF